MTLPNFLILGTAKSGTSSLASYLNKHPEVCFSRIQEPNFFAFEVQYAKGVSFYRSLYAHHAGEPCVGEKSWRYSCGEVYPEAYGRIRTMLPKIKLIYVLRDPLARGISMWRELRDAGQDIVDADPEKALLYDPLITDSMKYASTWNRFAEGYSEDNMLMVFFEDLINDPEGFYAQITDFLSIERFVPKEGIHENPSVGLRSDGRLLEWLRKNRLDRLARKMLPKTLGSIARTHLKSPIGKVELLPETRATFLDMVRPEAEAALEIAGKPKDFWTLE